MSGACASDELEPMEVDDLDDNTSQSLKDLELLGDSHQDPITELKSSMEKVKQFRVVNYLEFGSSQSFNSIIFYVSF